MKNLYCMQKESANKQRKVHGDGERWYCCWNKVPAEAEF